MSLWGVIVIINLVFVIFIVGFFIVEWLWGGFLVDNLILNRFFSIYYLLFFLIVGLVLVYLVLLYIDGFNNLLGINLKIDKLNFYLYFYVKDLIVFYCFIVLFLFFVLYYFNSLGYFDNYIEVDFLVIFVYIVFEWYFLFYYVILCLIFNKLGGVVVMGLLLGCLFLIVVIINIKVRSCKFRFL